MVTDIVTDKSNGPLRATPVRARDTLDAVRLVMPLVPPALTSAAIWGGRGGNPCVAACSFGDVTAQGARSPWRVRDAPVGDDLVGDEPAGEGKRAGGIDSMGIALRAPRGCEASGLFGDDDVDVLGGAPPPAQGQNVSVSAWFPWE